MPYYGDIPFGFSSKRRKGTKRKATKRAGKRRKAARGRKKKLKFGSRAYRQKYLGHA